MNDIESGVIHAIKTDLAYYYLAGASVHEQKTGIVEFLRACLDVDFRVLLYWRISSALCSRKSTKYFGILLYYRIKARYGVDLSPWAIVDPGVRLMHAFGVVIGPRVRIHEGTTIFHQVTLGLSRPDKQALLMPTIGRYCILGAGAKILGPVAIPDKSLVPANMLITTKNLRKSADCFASVSPDWSRNIEIALSHSSHNAIS